MRGKHSDPIASVIAQKQLYSSHYFRTALDLSVLQVVGARPGFRGEGLDAHKTSERTFPSTGSDIEA
jgi:hypothetical protein